MPNQRLEFVDMINTHVCDNNPQAPSKRKQQNPPLLKFPDIAPEPMPGIKTPCTVGRAAPNRALGHAVKSGYGRTRETGPKD